MSLILDFSYIPPEHLQDKITGLRVIEAFKSLESEKGQTVNYNMLFVGYAR